MQNNLYHHKQWGFSLKLPEGWKIKKVSEDPFTIVFRPVSDEQPSPSFIYVEITKSFSQEKWNTLKKEIKEDGAVRDLVEKELYQFPAIIFTRDFQGKNLYLLRNDILYHLLESNSSGTIESFTLLE